MRSMAVVLLFAVSGVVFPGEVFFVAKASAAMAPVEYVPVRHPRFDIIGAAVDKRVRPIVSGCSAFSGVVQERTTSPVALADGSYTFDLNALSFPLGEENPPERFHVNIYPRSGIFSRMFYEERFAHDLAAYEKWKAANPGFRCFYSWEIGNDAYLMWRRPGAILNPKREKHRLSMAKYEELKARKLPPTREAYVRNVLRPHFDRIVEWCFGDVGRMMIGEGDQCIEHLMAYWGVKEIGIETTRDYLFWQIQMMFCRGAARQFDKEWNWYIASYLSGKDGDSSFCAEDRSRLHGPNYGISQSSVKRAAYMTWLSGANSYQREGMGNTHFMFRTVSPRLSCEGEMFTNFVAFVRSHDRGNPYQPIALLVPAARGYSRRGGRAFAAYDYTHPDYMLDAIMSTALDFPENRVASNYAARVERVMANSHHGDVFDALTPDFPDQTAFRGAIGGYRAAILVGDYGRNAEMESILREYVRGGGTLVLNAMQLGGAFDAEFTGLEVVGERKDGDSTFAQLRLNGAKALRLSPGGEVTFAGHRFGAGRVIVVGRGSRLESAKKLGFRETVNFTEKEPVEAVRAMTNGLGVDAVFECSGANGTIRQAVHMCRKGGRVILLGVPYEEHDEPIPFKYVAHNEIMISGSRANPNVSWKFLSMIHNGNIAVKDMVTHTFPLDDMKKAMDVFVGRKENVMKVVIYPNGGEDA